MKKTIIFILSIIILLLILFNDTHIRVNIMTRLVILRGLVSPSCFWYKISDMFFSDGSGINIYNKLKLEYCDFAKVNVFNTDFYLVTNVNYIKLILDNSPDLFNVGSLKNKFFSTFMSKNVGISSGCPWKNRRKINDYALDNKKVHRFGGIYNEFINKITKFDNKIIDFSLLRNIGKQTMSKVIFNTDISNINEDVINIFSEANKISALYNKLDIDPTIYNNYKNTIYYYLNNPNKQSLIDLCLQITNNKDEVFHQIPHFIFPIVGLFLTTIPRLLCLLCNHLDIFQKLILEVNNNTIFNLQYMRQCILETLRLNNPVISMFRTLEQDISFDNKNKFKKGTQFLILTNPVLRSPNYFDKNNEFLPERWDSNMEESYYSLSFSQGPQKCPGKEIAIFLVESFTYNLIKNKKLNITNFNCNKKLDKKNILQVINPCDLVFTITN
jgi:hypothetical protein